MQQRFNGLGQQAALGAVRQLREKGDDLFGSLPKRLASRFVGVLGGVVEKRCHLGALDAPARSDARFEIWRIGIFGPVAGRTVLGPFTTLLQVEPGISQESARQVEPL